MLLFLDLTAVALSSSTSFISCQCSSAFQYTGLMLQPQLLPWSSVRVKTISADEAVGITMDPCKKKEAKRSLGTLFLLPYLWLFLLARVSLAL